jgi:histidinol-phosphatase (PHP family)
MNKVNPITADFHIHTPYCGHAHGRTIDYIENAIQRGLKEVCFTDHLGRYYLSKSQKKRYTDWGMNEYRLNRYIKELLDIQKSYKDSIEIKIGLEIDYIEGAEDLLAPVLEYPFDFLLGSIHCLPAIGWRHLATYSPKDSWPFYDEYFKTAKALISSGIFDSFAHIDFIWRYIKWPEKKTMKIAGLIKDSVKRAVSNDLAIEINSNGYLWSQIYNVAGGDPFEVLLESIKTFDAQITIGSDAHKPVFVGKIFDELARVLKTKGITQYCTFDKKKIVVQTIR